MEEREKKRAKVGRPLVRINSTPYINEYYVKPTAPLGLEDRLLLTDNDYNDKILVSQSLPDYRSHDEEEHNIEFGGRRIRKRSRKSKRRKTSKRHKKRKTKRRRRH